MKLFYYSVSLACLVQCFGVTARGETWAIGGIVGPHHGVSVHRGVSTEAAYHFAGHYTETDLYFSGDYQRHFLSPWQWHTTFPLFLYGGLGLSGEHAASDRQGERFFLRLPLGGQWNIPSLHMQVFAETAGKIGEIPQTEISAELRGGLRAYF